MHIKSFIAAAIAALLVSNANGIPVSAVHSADDDSISVINRVLFDFTTHVLQTGKLAAAMQNLQDGYVKPFFELARPYTFDFTKKVCSGNNSCERIHEQIQIGGLDESNEDFPYTTYLTGALDNDVSLVFDRTNFTYIFHVPNFGLYSSDYQRITTNLNTSVQHAYSGLELRVANSTVGITSEFQFTDYYSLSNLNVTLELGDVTMRVPSVAKFENGNWTDLPAIEKNAAPQVMELWRETDQDGVTLQRRYSYFLQEKINAILAGNSSF